MVFVRFSKTNVGVLYFADEKRPDLPPRHDFAPTRAGGCGKAIFPAEVRADYDENRLTL